MQHNKSRSLLILVAMEAEEKAILNALGQVFRQSIEHKIIQIDKSLGLRANQWCAKEFTLTVMRSGIGSVNSAVSLYAANGVLTRSQKLDAVFLLGVGGALSSQLNIGDLVVSDSVLQHDYFYSFSSKDQRIQPGAHIMTEEQARGHVASFVADTGWVEWLSKIGFSNAVRVGTVLSGNEFALRLDRKIALANLAENSLLVEMEAAGMAQVASALGIPFVVAKTVSDRLLPDGSIEEDFIKCLAIACENSAEIAVRLVNDFAIETKSPIF